MTGRPCLSCDRIPGARRVRVCDSSGPPHVRPWNFTTTRHCRVPHFHKRSRFASHPRYSRDAALAERSREGAVELPDLPPEASRPVLPRHPVDRGEDAARAVRAGAASTQTCSLRIRLDQSCQYTGAESTVDGSVIEGRQGRFSLHWLLLIPMILLILRIMIAC